MTKDDKKTDKKHVFRVSFVNYGQVYEVYVREIYQSELYGFIEVEEFLFGNRSQLVVDPGEERLKAEFCDVSRSYIPIHSILRIDEVEKEGVPKIMESKGGSNIAQFPSNSNFNMPPGIGSKKD